MHATIENSAISRILTESPITLDQARNELKPILGKRVDKTTLYRWCLRGVGGVKLEHARVGNQILVSLPAITRFIEARTAKAIGA
jgi:hypothetical protein